MLCKLHRHFANLRKALAAGEEGSPSPRGGLTGRLWCSARLRGDACSHEHLRDHAAIGRLNDWKTARRTNQLTPLAKNCL